MELRVLHAARPHRVDDHRGRHGPGHDRRRRRRRGTPCSSVLEPRRAPDARRPDGELPHARGGPGLRRADAARGRARPRAAAPGAPRRRHARASSVVAPTSSPTPWSAAIAREMRRRGAGARRGHRRRPRASTRSSRRCAAAGARRRRPARPGVARASARTWWSWAPRARTVWSSTRSSWSSPREIARRGVARRRRATPRGLRTLYVAMTRPTRRLAIVAIGNCPRPSDRRPSRRPVVAHRRGDFY